MIIRNQYWSTGASLTRQIGDARIENSGLPDQLEVGEMWNEAGHLGGETIGLNSRNDGKPSTLTEIDFPLPSGR